jgi:hypothetical protein
MKRVVKRILVLLTTLLAISGLGFSMANAQQSGGIANGFRISPVRSELTIEKGKSQSITINIDNPTNVATIAKPIVNDFVASDKENGEPRLILDDNAPSPKKSFKKLVGTIPEVELGPKEKKDVSVTITIPADASSGGYYGAIRFAPAVPGQTSTVGLTASVGTIILVRVPGNLVEKLDLLQLSASQNDKAKTFFTNGEASVMVRLQNTGDIHVQPFGKVLVKNIFGKTVYQYELNNTQPRSNVLPDSIRRFEDTIKAKRLFGRYTIEANLGYSQGSGDLLSAKATFWYLPIAAIYAIIVLLVAIVGLVYWLMRRSKARKLHKHDVNKKKN